MCLIGICLSPCTVSQTEIKTIPLRDAVIYAAREAKAAGATQYAYEANVVNTAEEDGSVVVPLLPVTASLGGKLTQQVGAKITITGYIMSEATKVPTGKAFLLNVNTLKLTQIPK